jgi:hypothetical protein
MEMNELPKRYQVISLKIDKEIVKKLKLIASENERSVLGQIRFILKDHVLASRYGKLYDE